MIFVTTQIMKNLGRPFLYNTCDSPAINCRIQCV